VARILADLVRNGLGAGPGPAIIAVLVGGGGGVLLYVTAARGMRVRELSGLKALIRGRRG
jgi:hypothetical protein